jgi:hypothetical protein
MHTRITRAACAAAAAGALTAVSLLAGAGAAAVPSSAAAGQAGKVPAGFQPAAASFYSPASGGVVLGGVGCLSGKPCRARLAATSDGGARWHLHRRGRLHARHAVTAPITAGLVA